MKSDDDYIIGLANPERDQYFLSSPKKLELLVRAAGIRPTDHVVEIGAGIGSVARAIPRSATLTLVELDDRYIDYLKGQVPHASVIQGDGLSVIESLQCDVLLSNLPTTLTCKLIAKLPGLTLRTAIVTAAVDFQPDLSGMDFTSEVVTFAGGDDFRPPQPIRTALLKLHRTLT